MTITVVLELSEALQQRIDKLAIAAGNTREDFVRYALEAAFIRFATRWIVLTHPQRVRVAPDRPSNALQGNHYGLRAQRGIG